MRGTMFMGAALLCGCGSAFSGASSGDGGGGADALDEPAHSEASADVGTDGWGDTLPDASADVVQDAHAHDAAPAPEAEAGMEAGPPCTPLTFPIAPPGGCADDFGPPITMPGSYWLLQPQATPAACWSRALSEAGAACEQCEQTFTCACLVASFGDGGPVGITCVAGGASGPYFTQ